MVETVKMMKTAEKWGTTGGFLTWWKVIPGPSSSHDHYHRAGSGFTRCAMDARLACKCMDQSLYTYIA